MEPSDLFVFAGAGVSRSMPANLPVFWQIRDAVLSKLRINDYVEGTEHADAGKIAVAQGLLPEPFMLALVRAGVDVEGWLSALLGRSRPNAAHQALAALAEAGARVWTVNFDRLIEHAAPGLRVTAWPSAPDPTAQLTKPHGTVGGRLIVTAEQVLQPLSEEWRRRLAEDVAGRVVIFIGYSGNDLDFRPVWDTVLDAANQVLWFDVTDPEAQRRKELILRRVASTGRLHFPACRPPAGHRENPSYDFVRFVVDEGLVSLGDDVIDELFDNPADIGWPPLSARSLAAESAVRSTLGDVRGAQRRLIRQTGQGPARLSALENLVRLTVTHGNRPVSVALAVTSALIPPFGPGRRLRAAGRHKRVTILANQGRHRAVLRATRRLLSHHTSTELILRSASERYLVSLDAAARTAAHALRLALEERHNVLVAHASYQLALALVWAERVTEAQECLDSQLGPYAQLAANRWVAWADFIAGQLLVRSPNASSAREARNRLDLSRSRFAAEALVDGVVSAETAALTARRRAGELMTFAADAERLRSRIRRRRGGRYYARAHRFSLDAVDLELAEHARVHDSDLGTARHRYARIATSPYPLHRSLGLLGLALVSDVSGDRHACAQQALEVAHPFGAGLVVQRAQQVLAEAPGADDEIFFC